MCFLRGESAMSTRPDLRQQEIIVDKIYRNLAPAKLYEMALRHEKSSVVSTGALATCSGAKTGRSPKDKRIVDLPPSNKDVWWGPVNIKLEEMSYVRNRQRAIDFLNTRDYLYVVDGYAGWDPKYRLKVRVICAEAYHALFMHNMMIRPTPQELDGFGEQ
jgi:phosphoenolpyruvate carboxykinase (ATP)